MRRQREDTYPVEAFELKQGTLSEPMQEYITFLKTNIKQLGLQIDFEFEHASELIFRYQ